MAYRVPSFFSVPKGEPILRSVFASTIREMDTYLVVRVTIYLLFIVLVV